MRAPARRPAAPGSPWRIVAAVTACALAPVGAAAGPNLGIPAVLGALIAAVAGLLAVLALPSIPTKRATVLVLAAGGLGALRHAALPTTDSALIVIWVIGSILAFVLADRAEAEEAPPLTGGPPLAPRVAEAVRVSVAIGAAVAIMAVATVPTITEQLSRRIWPGIVPGLNDRASAADSLRASRRLDMTNRPRLSDDVVFTVDSPRPDFWRGEIYDVWDGQGWSRSDSRVVPLARVGGEVQLQTDPLDESAQRGVEFDQTFQIETGFAELLFAAPSPIAVQSDRLVVGRPDGTAGVVDGFGRGSVYTVTSRSSLATEHDLRAAQGARIPAEILERYAQVPLSTARVRTLAQSITAGESTTYDKIRAIERWLGANTKYSLNAPLSPNGVDIVDHFLFESRQGWCEQVASSLVVLARSAGIPARLATGFVTGSVDELTGRFVVREKDAHAWTEVFFPGIGWQGFDPTASVSLSGEAAPARSWLEIARDNAVPFGLALGAIVWLFFAGPELLVAIGRWRSQRRSWPARTLARLERLGARVGRARRPSETYREYSRALARELGSPELVRVGDTLDRDAFAADGSSTEARADADAVLNDALARRDGVLSSLRP
ncbi:MAG: transglutaminase family protein [Actinomycetota bacterium]